MKVCKVLSVMLVVLVGLSGPVAVSAQSKEAEPAPMTAAGTAPAEETDKVDGKEIAYKVGAGVFTVINLPLRGALCVLGVTAGLVVLVITFGSGSRAAARATEEGCGGPWVITPAHLKGDPAKGDGNN